MIIQVIIYTFLYVSNNLNVFILENGESKLLQAPANISSNEESDVKNVSYTYTLWVGTNVTEVFSLSLTSPKNTSFFKAMTQAAELDAR